MVEVVAVVEGQTEQTFVRDVLAGHLILHGVTIWGVLSGRARKRGGVPPWSSARDDIIRTLKEDRYVTTMFDFYGMPLDWPGRRDASSLPPARRGEAVEALMAADIAEAMGGKRQAHNFLPYVQLHEFEAILFSDTKRLVESLIPIARADSSRLEREVEEIVAECGAPEAIDDGYETCPSRRITRMVSAYRKPVLGPIIATRIGLDAIRASCPHFADWITKLERLAASPASGEA